MTNAQEHEVRRLFARYQTEVVEQFALCPWARPARLQAEVAVAVVTPADLPVSAWQPGQQLELPSQMAIAVCSAAQQMISNPSTKVGIIIVLAAACDRIALRELRNRVSQAVPTVGVADFHPDAALDLATPARLVSYLRCTPDPVLQIVPFSILDEVRSGTQTVDRAAQLAMLGGISAPANASSQDIGDVIANRNHATINLDRGAALQAVLHSIAEDRLQSYQRVGLLP
jgi:hypothetical protein